MSLRVVQGYPYVLRYGAFNGVSPAIRQSQSLVDCQDGQDAPVALTIAAARVLHFQISRDLVEGEAVRGVLVVIRLTRDFNDLYSAVIIVNVFRYFKGQLHLFIGQSMTVPRVIKRAIMVFIRNDHFRHLVHPFMIRAFRAFSSRVHRSKSHVVTSRTPDLISMGEPSQRRFLRTLIGINRRQVNSINVCILVRWVRPKVRDPMNIPREGDHVINGTFHLLSVLIRPPRATVRVLRGGQVRNNVMNEDVGHFLYLPINDCPMFLRFFLPGFLPFLFRTIGYRSIRFLRVRLHPKNASKESNHFRSRFLPFPDYREGTDRRILPPDLAITPRPKYVVSRQLLILRRTRAHRFSKGSDYGVSVTFESPPFRRLVTDSNQVIFRTRINPFTQLPGHVIRVGRSG